jgi:hypothetical protein
MDSPASAGLASGFDVEYAATVEINIPIGWASYLKDFIMSYTSVCKIVWVMTFEENFYSNDYEGSSPYMSKKDTSKKVDFSANYSMGIPLY